MSYKRRVLDEVIMRPQAPLPPHDSGIAARGVDPDGIDRVMASGAASLNVLILTPDDLVRNHRAVGQPVKMRIGALRQVYADQAAVARHSHSVLPLAVEVIERHDSPCRNRSDAQRYDYPETAHIRGGLTTGSGTAAETGASLETMILEVHEPVNCTPGRRLPAPSVRAVHFNLSVWVRSKCPRRRKVKTVPPAC